MCKGQHVLDHVHTGLIDTTFLRPHVRPLGEREGLTPSCGRGREGGARERCFVVAMRNISSGTGGDVLSERLIDRLPFGERGDGHDLLLWGVAQPLPLCVLRGGIS